MVVQQPMVVMTPVAIMSRPWKVGLCQAPCAAPGKFCYFCFCPCCGTYSQRMMMLQRENSPYYCFDIRYGCLSCKCPFWCLWCEVCCAPAAATITNRQMIRQRRFIAPNCCEDCIICCLGGSNATGAAAAATPGRHGGGPILMALRCILKCACAAAMGCFVTQHQIEIEEMYGLSGMVAPQPMMQVMQ